MKKILLASIIFLSLTVNAQNQFAFFDIEQIFSIMPEAEYAQAQLEAEQAKILAKIDEMQVNFNNLYQDFLTNAELPDGHADKWLAVDSEDKQLELMGLQERMERYQTSASETLQTRQVELLMPVYNKVDSAVSIVTEDKGYIMVFEKSQVYHVNETKCDDVTSLIKKVLGLIE